MSIQWFPGHMVAAQKKAAETMEFTDVVIEVLDARMPGASQNPMIKQLGAARQRAHLKVLNKSDLADPKITDQWIQFFNAMPKTKAIAISCKKSGDSKKILTACELLAPHRSSPLKPLRMMIMGVPNVGKSTIMNAILNKRIAKVGDEPAVTKQQQRHQINDHMILVDTPGMMWPKIESEIQGNILAANNAIGKNAYYEDEVAISLASFLLKKYPSLLVSRYKILEMSEDIDALTILEIIAKKNNYQKIDAQLRIIKASNILLNDYRKGKLGRVSLERPEDYCSKDH